MIQLSLHGPTAAAHEYHTGETGSFAVALDALAAARREGTRATVTTWITRSSFRVLADMIPLLSERGVAEWHLEVPIVEREAFDRVAPRLALALPYALHAVDRARKAGVRAFVRGAPLCLLGPYARFALPSDPRAYGVPCVRCAARPDCCGVQQAYLDRFHADELRPIPGGTPSDGSG